MEYSIIFLLILPIVAFLYAAVGHGGASGYLALMAIFGFATQDMKVIALLLNLFVAGVSFYLFWSKGFFNKNIFIPFALGSIPAAFIGGTLGVDAFWFKKILAVLLLFAVLRMLNVFGKEKTVIKPVQFLPALIIGAGIGFLSGMIGIGGGIILSPVILLLGWGKMKETAAVSALFIFVNSAAGLIGVAMNSIALEVSQLTIIICIAVALVGGFAGAYWGSGLKSLKQLKFVLAFVLLIAVVKLVLV